MTALTGWPQSTIGHEFDVQLGKRVDAAVNRGVPRTCINNRGVRWGNIRTEEAIEALLTPSDLKSLRLERGDVLVCEGGEIGRAAMWIDELPEAYFLNTLHRLRSRGRVDPRLLVALLERWSSTGELAALVGKATLAHLTKENLLKAPIPVPPAQVQHAIGEALGSVAAIISALEQVIAKKEAVRLGMMQELLSGRTRLPGYTADWRRARLGDVLAVRHGRSQHEVEVDSGMYPILATGGQIGWTDTPIYSKPSVLIGRKGTIDRPQFQDAPFWTVDTLFYTEITSQVDAKFLYYVFLTVDWRSMNEASGVPSLSSSRIEGVAVSLPNLDEQREIRSVLDAADVEITALSARLIKARAIKEGMMQQLLTGRMRLSVPTLEPAGEPS